MTTTIAERLIGDLAPLHLDAREIHVWSIPIDVGGDDVPGLMALLSSPEQERAQRYIIESVQQRFMATRAALRAGVGDVGLRARR